MVDSRYADDVDHQGQTLIPPSLHQFAETFQGDLKSVLGLDLQLTQGTKRGPDTIFVTLGNNSNFQDVAGRFTAEGYELEVDDTGIVVTGASPLGAWWATRSIIQAAVAGNSTLETGSGVDAPGWGTRGIMVSLISQEQLIIANTLPSSSMPGANTTHRISWSRCARTSRSSSRTLFIYT